MRRQRSDTHPAAGKPRPSRRIHDEKRPGGGGRPKETAVCRRCGLSYRAGRWTSKAAPAGAHETLCPACERIEQGYPGGVLHVGGGFAREHREEILSLLRNFEENERSDHPLNRIMAIEDEEGGYRVETTEGKLAQSLGRALHSAYDGELEHPGTTADTENLVRVRWTRD